MNVRYLNFFILGFEDSSFQQQRKIISTIESLVTFLEKKTKLSVELGLKKLRSNFWEIRIDIKIRVIFTLNPNLITFVLVGTHEKIKRYLKQI